MRGSSAAIVPARSHELVMLTRDCRSSDQKYPQVVPWNIQKQRTYESHEKARDERNLLFKHLNLSRLKLENLLVPRAVNKSRKFYQTFDRACRLRGRDNYETVCPTNTR